MGFVGAVGCVVVYVTMSEDPGFDLAGGQDLSHLLDVPIAHANSCSFHPDHAHCLYMTYGHSNGLFICQHLPCP